MLRFFQWLVAQESILRALNPLFGLYNPFLASYRRNPHPLWRRMREQEPIYFSPVFRVHVLTRYADVHFVLRDKNFTTDRSKTALMRLVKRMTRNDPEFSGMIERNLLMLDGEDHRKLRGLVSKAFTPRRVEALRPRMQDIVEELLDRWKPESEVDLMRDLARPLPVAVIAELLGVPREDWNRLRAWSTDLAQLLDPLQARGGDRVVRAANQELNAYWRPLLEARRKEPRDDLLSAMLQAEEDGEKLGERDLLALLNLLLVAGHETTTNLIGTAVLALVDHPAERRRLTDDPSLIATAVDEFLRFDGPIQLTDRAAKSDCKIAGRAIRAGQLVALSLAGANRDPARFADPDRLDLGRRDNPHLAFGHGNHFCIGSQLARLETELAITALLRRFPDFEMPRAPAAWRRSIIIRGPLDLTLRIGSGARDG